MWVLWAVVIAAQPLLGQMEQAYKRSEFERVLDLANTQRDQSQWSAADLSRFHELSGLAHLFMEDRGNAEKEFRQVFRLQPNYEADKKRSPPAVLEFVEYVRARIRDDALRVEPAQPPEPAVAAPAAPVDAPKFNPLSLIPFGIGQLATGDYTAGTIFISFDVALFAASLSLYLVRQSERAPGDEYLNKPRADAMQIAQNVLSGAFVAVAIIGFVDALVWSPKRVAEKKRIMVVPTVSASAFGTAMGGIAVLGAF